MMATSSDRAARSASAWVVAMSDERVAVTSASMFSFSRQADRTACRATSDSSGPSRVEVAVDLDARTCSILGGAERPVHQPRRGVQGIDRSRTVPARHRATRSVATSTDPA